MHTTQHRDTLIELARDRLCPAKIDVFAEAGFVPIMGRREGHYFWDTDGRRLFDVHINGGTFNLGHRHPELIETLRWALDHVDIGNHHFVSEPRVELADTLCRSTRVGHQFAVFAASGGEAVDVALRSARRATGRRRIIAMRGGYHGHVGLALSASDSDDAEFFLSDGESSAITQVPFNDLAAIEAELAAGDVAAVIVESIPATSGFPMPEPGYLAAVKDACVRVDALYIADEVQTGLGRTGVLWAVEDQGVDPDIMVIGKGLSGGLYPIAATLLSDRAGAWLRENGWGHSSTFAGSELGCIVGLKAFELVTRDGVLDNVMATSDRLGDRLDMMRSTYPILADVRRRGFVIGLEFDHPRGGEIMTVLARAAGAWGFVAGYRRSVLQVLPDLLVDGEAADELAGMLEAAVAMFQDLID